jgi:hypothetical protein
VSSKPESVATPPRPEGAFIEVVDNGASVGIVQKHARQVHGPGTCWSPFFPGHHDLPPKVPGRARPWIIVTGIGQLRLEWPAIRRGAWARSWAKLGPGQRHPVCRVPGASWPAPAALPPRHRGTRAPEGATRIDGRSLELA